MAACVLLLALFCYGYFSPSSSNWGYHFLGFLPLPIVIAFFLLSAVIVIAVWMGSTERLLDVLVAFMEKRPLLFVSLACTIFILVSTFLRVKAPLLGDSFILLNNYEFTFSGDHPLHLFRSPLAFAYFYAFGSLLNTPVYPGLMDAFLAGEVALGVGLILCTYFISKLLFENHKERLLAFCFLLVLPYMQVLFGYAELYSVVLFLLAVYILVSLLHLKKKIPFYALPPAFLLLYAANYLNIILLPAILYSALIEFRSGKKWTIVTGIFICGVILFGVFAAVNFDTQRFFQSTEGGHWLSLTRPSGDQFEAYSLFSPIHLRELFNIFILLAPAAIFFVLSGLLGEKIFPVIDEVNGFFLSLVTLFFGFIAVVKLDLGFPFDWDVSSAYFFGVNLFALKLFFQTSLPDKTRVVTLFLSITLLTSLSWFLVNSSTNGAIKRTETLLNRSIISPSGMYQSMFHLSSYYQKNKLLPEQINVWKRYTAMFPEDWHGLRNLAKSYYEGGEAYDSLTQTAFENWILVDSATTRGKSEYANFLSERGLTNYQRHNFPEAEKQFRSAILYNPNLTAAYNNLAILYLDNKMPDSAIAFCREAIGMNPVYTLAYQNMANAFAQEAEFDTAIVYYQKVISIDPTYVQAYENLSRAYYRKGDKTQAMEMLRQAARLGSRTAQSLLTMSGE